MCRSVPQRLVASTWTRTSSGPICGTGTSVRVRPGAASSLRIARIVCGMAASGPFFRAFLQRRLEAVHVVRHDLSNDAPDQGADGRDLQLVVDLAVEAGPAVLRAEVPR